MISEKHSNTCDGDNLHAANLNSAFKVYGDNKNILY